MPAIDLLQFHAWNYADPSWLDALFHLQDLKREGLIRHLGLTNVDAAHLRVVLASGIEVVSNQVSCSLIDRRAAGRLAGVCAEFGVGLLAYGTVCGGWLSEKWLGQDEPDWETDRHLVADEVRTLHPRGRRLGGAAARAARGEGRGRRGTTCRSRTWRRASSSSSRAWRRSSSARGSANARTSTTTCGCARSSSRATTARISRPRIATLTPIPGDCGDEYRTPPFLTASGDLSHHLDTMPPPFAVRPGPNGTHQVLQRHAVGAGGRLLAGDARRLAHPRLGHHRHARQPPHRRRRSGGADARRHRQDRRRAAVARRPARGRRAHAHLRLGRRALGAGVARARRTLRPHPAGQHAGRGPPHRRRVPGRDRGGGGGACRRGSGLGSRARGLGFASLAAVPLLRKPVPARSIASVASSPKDGSRRAQRSRDLPEPRSPGPEPR